MTIQTFQIQIIKTTFICTRLYFDIKIFMHCYGLLKYKVVPYQAHKVDPGPAHKVVPGPAHNVYAVLYMSIK